MAARMKRSLATGYQNESKHKCCRVLDLPGDVYGNILGLFPLIDLIRLCLTCTKMRVTVHAKASIVVNGNSCSVLGQYKMFRGLKFSVRTPTMEYVRGLLTEMETMPGVMRSISSMTIVNSEDVSRVLEKLEVKSLVRLRVNDVMSGDEKAICRFSRLVKLEIRDADTFGDADLVRLVKLKDLKLGETPLITSWGIGQLENLTDLCLLDRDIGSSDWVYLTRVTKLRLASRRPAEIREIKVGRGLGQLSHLRELALYDVRVDIREIRELALRSLRLFYVGFCHENISEESTNIWDFSEWTLETLGIGVWGNWHMIRERLLLPVTLRKLEIRHGYLADVLIRNNLINLTSLVLSFSHTFDDEKIGYGHIGGLINLRELSLNKKAKIYNADVIGLTKLTHLVMNDMITDDGIEGLFNMRRLVLNGLVSDRGIGMLRKLTFLDMNYNEKVTDRGLMGLRELVEVNLRMNKRISDVSLKKLINLQKVEVEFSGVKFDLRWLEGNGVHVVWNYVDKVKFCRLFPEMCRGKLVNKIDRFFVEFEDVRLFDHHGDGATTIVIPLIILVAAIFLIGRLIDTLAGLLWMR
ncbi:MAG: hypothetical protein Hyperionvirus11_17 [Hyperionvirus sp.]|uniref:F-box domain-containing protein n=1 Tax=Hyperionvirus sp. TaxID=2487770 RepID=A0A3G5AAX9_9VIRU|nr:MAG: hypothetical protein Hyperionvirus11_17 [Hyperionvirus sp.]